MLATLYKLYGEHPEICTDSRNIKKNCIFFALKGEHFDGNMFAMQALKEGAAYAVVDEAAIPQNERIVKVENVLETLQELANYHRQQIAIPIIAITGTNGKTTTKELVAKVLSVKYKIRVTQGNLNNHIGVPLTLLRMNADTQLGVVEMGANHVGEIAALCRIAEPDYGLITNVGKAHIEGFGSLAGVKKAKGELYDFLQSTGGRIFYNADNTMLCEMLRERDITNAVAYGLNKDHGSVLPNDTEHPFLRLMFPERQSIATHLIGNYNADNVLAAIAVGKHFDISLQAASPAIESYQPSNNRSQLLRTATNNIIMDAYNANPTSMRVAIENFAQLQMPNKWLILGDMKELGSETGKEHKAIADLLKEKHFKNIIFIGEAFRKVATGELWHCFSMVDDFIYYLEKHPLQHATILVKGSHSTSLEKLSAYL